MKKRKRSEPEEALRAARWYYKNMGEERDEPEPSGWSLTILTTYWLFFSRTLFAAFRINMWTRAMERRFLRHRLCSRIKDDQPQGYAAFD